MWVFRFPLPELWDRANGTEPVGSLSQRPGALPIIWPFFRRGQDKMVRDAVRKANTYAEWYMRQGVTGDVGTLESCLRGGAQWCSTTP